MEILPISTIYQQADIFTKPVDEATLIRLRLLIMGW
jgi:hypothetical protein